MPIRKSDYPPDWPAISLSVRTEAGWQCEWCGAPGGKVIRRLGRVEEKELHIGCSQSTQLYRVDWERIFGDITTPGTCIVEPVTTMSWKRLRFHGLTKIILTVAHHDIRQHIANRKYGRLHAKEPQGRLDFDRSL